MPHDREDTKRFYKVLFWEVGVLGPKLQNSVIILLLTDSVFFLNLILIRVAHPQRNLKGAVIVKEAYSGGMDLHDFHPLDDRPLGDGNPVNHSDPF